MSKLGTAFKLALALAIIVWMVDGGRLNLGQLAIFASQPGLAWLAVAYWLIGPVILASIRWRILLVSAGYRLSIPGSIRLQLISFFFTTVLPGSLGGDVVKVFYLIRDNPHRDRSTALWAILLDRLIGMCGLFLIGMLFITLNFDTLWRIGLLRPLIVLVYGYVAMFAAFLLALKLLDAQPDAHRAPAAGLIGRVWQRLYDFMTACRIYRNKLGAIAFSLLLSTLSHGLSFVLFAALAWSLWGHGGSTAELAAIFPIGMLITTLPLSPGGLGVGHFAFEHLFSLLDLSQGANVYNAYFVSQLLLNLTGVLAYLGHRRDAPSSTAPTHPVKASP